MDIIIDSYNFWNMEAMKYWPLSAYALHSAFRTEGRVDEGWLQYFIASIFQKS